MCVVPHNETDIAPQQNKIINAPIEYEPDIISSRTARSNRTLNMEISPMELEGIPKNNFDEMLGNFCEELGTDIVNKLIKSKNLKSKIKKS